MPYLTVSGMWHPLSWALEVGQRCSAALKHLFMPWLLAGPQPLALQEKPWALHTTPHRCLPSHSELCCQELLAGCFAHKPSRCPQSLGP